MTHYLMNGIDGQYPITEQIKLLICSAQSYIKVANFSFAHEEIKDLLMEAMQRGVTLFILGNNPQEGQGEWVDTSEYSANQQNLFELEKAGAHVRLLLDLHAKFMIVDGRVALLTSCNFSYGSLERNVEAGIMLAERERKELERVFEILYMHADIYDYRQQGLSTLKGKQRIPITETLFASMRTSRLRCTLATRRDTNLSKCQINDLYHEVIRLVEEAQEYCYIVSWHFKEPWELKDLDKALRRARQRGVRLYLYSNIAEGGQDRDGKARAAREYLVQKRGCLSYGNNNNHSKCVLNEREGLMFTANIDARDGLLSGFEVGCLLSQEEYREALTQIQTLIANKR